MAEDEKKDRKDQSEEIPAWFAKYADSMEKTHSEILNRLGELEKEGKKEVNASADKHDRKDMSPEDIKENTDGEKRSDAEVDKKEASEAAEEMDERKKEDKKDRKDESEEKKEEDLKEGGHKANEERWAKEREDRARADAQHAKEKREMENKIKEMESMIKGLYREPSFEDRNALAAARARADATYQAVSGRPASEPLPGESPIAYRKRMVDGLRKFSARFKDERVDSLSGVVFDQIENQIYADAQEMARSPEVIKVGELRAVTRQDSGHTITEYTGDPSAAWEPFSRGASMKVKLVRPLH